MLEWMIVYYNRSIVSSVFIDSYERNVRLRGLPHCPCIECHVCEVCARTQMIIGCFENGTSKNTFIVEQFHLMNMILAILLKNEFEFDWSNVKITFSSVTGGRKVLGQNACSFLACLKVFQMSKELCVRARILCSFRICAQKFCICFCSRVVRKSSKGLKKWVWTANKQVFPNPHKSLCDGVKNCQSG